jgi:hypothetical protein
MIIFNSLYVMYWHLSLIILEDLMLKFNYVFLGLIFLVQASAEPIT